jgi:hypothetical protein
MSVLFVIPFLIFLIKKLRNWKLRLKMWNSEVYNYTIELGWIHVFEKKNSTNTAPWDVTPYIVDGKHDVSPET